MIAPPRHSAGFYVLIIFAVLLLAFAGLIAYYTWLIARGEGEKLSQSFSSKFTQNSQTTVAPTIVSVDSLKAIIRQSNPRFGQTEAPVTIVAFIDFECPFCQDGYATFADIKTRYAPVAQIIFKNFPIAQIHPRAIPAASAGVCAAAQNNFWPFYDQLFINKKLSDTDLKTTAQNLGLDRAQFANCLTDAKTVAAVEQDYNDGLRLGVRGTPTYFVNGQKIEGVISSVEWDKIMVAALKK